MAYSEPGQLLTVAEVAEWLRLHPITVRRHIKAGRIRAVRIGRAVRVPEAEVAKFGRAFRDSARVSDMKTAYRVTSPERREYERRLSERTPEEWASIREAAGRMLEERDRMPPLGISTTELLRESRREIEERDERRARGRR